MRHQWVTDSRAGTLCVFYRLSNRHGTRGSCLHICMNQSAGKECLEITVTRQLSRGVISTRNARLAHEFRVLSIRVQNVHLFNPNSAPLTFPVAPRGLKVLMRGSGKQYVEPIHHQSYCFRVMLVSFKTHKTEHCSIRSGFRSPCFRAAAILT